MQIEWTLEGAKGFMAEGKETCNLVAEASDKVVLALDKLPDTMYSQKFMDWTKITITLTR